MRRLFLLVLSFLVWWLIIGACAPALTPPPATEVKAPEAAVPAAKPAWEQKWEAVVAEGKKEGGVDVITSWGGETRTELTGVFKNKYAIDLEFSPAARGAELAAKVKAEQSAGLYLHDFFGIGSSTVFQLLKPAGLMGDIETLLILPEVKDSKYWRGGKFPFIDEDRQLIALASVKQTYVVYNTDLVKKGEITSYKDVLKPQYKGKITLNDPTVTGAGNAMMTLLALDIWNMEEAKEFLRQLIKQQEVVIQRDNRLHVESVARGKYAIGIGANPESVADMITAGTPLDVAKLREGYLCSHGSGVISSPNKLAHPNAAIIFINWLLTREGQILFSKGYGTPSMRVDVPTEGINPALLFQPDEKLFPYDEKRSTFMTEMATINKKIIEEDMK